MYNNTLITNGSKMRFIRECRNVTQEIMGTSLEFPYESAKIRISQYEKGIRFPKKELLEKFCKITKTSIYNFRPAASDDTNLIKELMWLNLKGYIDNEMAAHIVKNNKAARDWLEYIHKYENKEINLHTYRMLLLSWPESL